MAIVPDLSGNNPGNPVTNGWDGTDDHNITVDELQRDYYAGGGASDYWHSVLVLTTAAASRTALGADNAVNLTTGVLDPARIPAINSAVQVISSGNIAALTAPQQAQIVAGAVVTTTDGRRWVYTSGTKTLEASYIELSDVTPDWSIIANKPTWVTALTTVVPSADTNALTGVLGTGTAAAKEDHQHPYPLGTINTQTGTTYTLQTSDHGKVVELTNASAITLTLPNSLGIGFNCSLYQGGAGQVTLSAAGGATIRQRYSLTKTSGLYAEVAVRVRTNSGGSAAEYVASGDMA